MEWSENFESIVLYSSKRIDKFNLNILTKNFLSNTGLPKDAAPFLSFSDDSDEPYGGIVKLTDSFDFLESEFEKYIVIGSNGSGDEIVIDTNDECKIKLLDHEDYFSEELMNTSIEKLYHSLIIYQNFVDTVQKELGEDALFDCLYTESHIESLKKELYKNDPDSMNKNCFWLNEIELLIINKEEA